MGWCSVQSGVWVGASVRVGCGLVLQTEQSVGWCSIQSVMWVNAPEWSVVGSPHRSVCGLVLQTEWNVGWCSRHNRVWVSAQDRHMCPSRLWEMTKHILVKLQKIKPLNESVDHSVKSVVGYSMNLNVTKWTCCLIVPYMREQYLHRDAPRRKT